MPASIVFRFQSLDAYDEEAAYRLVEERAWPHGAICPNCGTHGRANKLQGATTRIGTYKCYRCRKPFTVKMGTAFEDSHVRLHLWLRAIYLLAACRKPATAYQLCSLLDISKKTAVAMIRRMQTAGIRPSDADTASQPVDHANGNGSNPMYPGSLNGEHHGDTGNGRITKQIYGVTNSLRQPKKHDDLMFERFFAEVQRHSLDNSDELFENALNRMLRPRGVRVRAPKATLVPVDRVTAHGSRPLTYRAIEQSRRIKIGYT